MVANCVASYMYVASHLQRCTVDTYLVGLHTGETLLCETEGRG